MKQQNSDIVNWYAIIQQRQIFWDTFQNDLKNLLIVKLSKTKIYTINLFDFGICELLLLKLLHNYRVK